VLIPHLPALSAAIHGKAKGGSAEAAAGWEDTATQATGHTTLCVSSQVRCWGLSLLHWSVPAPPIDLRLRFRLQLQALLSYCVCVSYQFACLLACSLARQKVGCARGCTFCRTGAMGLLRCLSAEEILAQVRPFLRALWPSSFRLLAQSWPLTFSLARSISRALVFASSLGS
jgi:hypothetical protein